MTSIKSKTIALGAEKLESAGNGTPTKTLEEKTRTSNMDGKDIIDGRVVVSSDYFSNHLIGLTHPNVPKFQLEKTPACSSISYEKMTTVREGPDGEPIAKREAEIFVDDFYHVATVQEHQGDFLVYLESDFTTELFTIHQDDFNKAIKKATQWTIGNQKIE